MESSSKPLATESFSYSWLTQENPYPSSDHIIDLTSFLPEQESFDFDVPQVTEISTTSLVHADEIFLDGKIKPFYDTNGSSSTKLDQAWKSSTSVPSSPFSSRSNFILVNKNQYYFIKRWRKSSTRILRKCFGFVKPLCQTLGCSRKNIRVNDLNRKVCENRRGNSVESSPRNSISISADYSVLDWDDFKKIEGKVDRTDVYYELKKVKSWSKYLPEQISPLQCSNYSNDWCEVESSIHEAILYCKRSIEK